EAFKRVIAERPFTIDAFVLLPDHIHCIWTLPENDNDFSTRWRLFKSFFTKGCRDELKGPQTDSMLKKGEQAVWQRRFWEHTIRDEDDFIRHTDYIHYNPVKHGLAESPKDWPHTSFHRYVDMGVYDREWGSGREMAFDECVGRE
ncbi:MAG: transposase, partial [Deltaproteobacteria bacterium]|nr:transposase [Deltaproteobacteria bacterium]